MMVRRRRVFVASFVLPLLVMLAVACGPVRPGIPVVYTDTQETKGARPMTVLLDQAAAMSVAEYNPASVIQAVNALQPLGKDKALEAIASYLGSRDTSQDATGLFWVLRVLFDVPVERGFPPVRIGQPTIPPPADPATLPRYPIVMVQDVPLLAIRGYHLGGLPEPVEAHVAYFRTHGTIRSRPLAPPAALDGIEEDFLRQWRTAYGDAYAAQARATIQEQIIRLRGARP